MAPLLTFLQANGVAEGFDPTLLAMLDGPGAAAIMTSYGVPPGTPIIPISTLKSVLPSTGGPLWLSLVELDIALLIQTVMLAGSVSLLALGPPAPAVPITPVAQLIQPSLLFPPLMSDTNKVLGIAKAMLEWAVSLIIPGDPRIAGTFIVIRPPPPPIGSLIPASLSAAEITAVIDAALGDVSESIRRDVLALTVSEPTTLVPVPTPGAPARGEPGSNPANDCACD